MTDHLRRFPAAWTVEDYRGITYIVRDANRFAVAYVFFEWEPRRRGAANSMKASTIRHVIAPIMLGL